MPRKLLRVALVAAVIPALTPVMSFAQTTKPGSTSRQAATSPAAKPATLSLWQRLRGQKPAAPVAAKETPAPKVAAGTKPAPTSRPGLITKAAPKMTVDSASKILRVSDEQASPVSSTKPRTSAEFPVEPVITSSRQPTAADFEDVFPDDKPTQRRGRLTSAVQTDVATPVQTEVVESAQSATAAPVETDFATPVESVEAAPVTVEQSVEQPAVQPEAYPINSAAPPRDMTAEYNAPHGEAPRYDHVGMMAPETQANNVRFTNPVPGRSISTTMNGMPAANQVPVTYGGPVGFVRLDGAMYPSPQPNIPFDVGTTMITNPALDPHEMLYAHRYRGLYGPFYHKTYRHWVMTPFGICKNEKRVLVGTEVRVNYKSHISPFSLFFPPVTH